VEADNAPSILVLMDMLVQRLTVAAAAEAPKEAFAIMRTHFDLMLNSIDDDLLIPHLAPHVPFSG